MPHRLLFASSLIALTFGCSTPPGESAAHDLTSFYSVHCVAALTGNHTPEERLHSLNELFADTLPLEHRRTAINGMCVLVFTTDAASLPPRPLLSWIRGATSPDEDIRHYSRHCLALYANKSPSFEKLVIQVCTDGHIDVAEVLRLKNKKPVLFLVT